MVLIGWVAASLVYARTDQGSGGFAENATFFIGLLLCAPPALGVWLLGAFVLRRRARR